MRYAAQENFLRVIHWAEPSHVCDLGVEPVSQGLSYHGAWPRDVRPFPTCRRWRDAWGVGWMDADGELFPVEPAIGGIDELKRLRSPDARALRIRERLERAAAGIDRRTWRLGVNHPYFLYEKAFNLLGPEEFLCALVGAPRQAEALLDLVLDWELRMAAEYVRLRPEHINVSDDYGMQDRLAVSPAMWRRFFKPRLARLLDFYRAALGPDIVISLHSCGHVMPILDDLVEIGVMVLNPVQSTANDLAAMRRRTSRRLVLAGGIDGQQILPHGSPAEVRAEVERKLDLLWEDGGYLPMAEKLLGVSKANVEVMHRAVSDWSRVHVEQARAAAG